MMVDGRGQYQDQYVTATKQSHGPDANCTDSLHPTVPVQQACLQAEKQIYMAKAVGQQSKLPQTTPLVMTRIPQLKVE